MDLVSWFEDPFSECSQGSELVVLDLSFYLPFDLSRGHCVLFLPSCFRVNDEFLRLFKFSYFRDLFDVVPRWPFLFVCFYPETGLVFRCLFICLRGRFRKWPELILIFVVSTFFRLMPVKLYGLLYKSGYTAGLISWVLSYYLFPSSVCCFPLISETHLLLSRESYLDDGGGVCPSYYVVGSIAAFLLLRLVYIVPLIDTCSDSVFFCIKKSQQLANVLPPLFFLHHQEGADVVVVV